MPEPASVSAELGASTISQVIHQYKEEKVEPTARHNRKRKVYDTDIIVNKSNYEDFERTLLSKLWKDVDSNNRVVWKCFDCEKTSHRKDSMKYHVEKHVEGFAHKCKDCDLVYKTRAGLYDHSNRKHKK